MVEKNECISKNQSLGLDASNLSKIMPKPQLPSAISCDLSVNLSSVAAPMSPNLYLLFFIFMNAKNMLLAGCLLALLGVVMGAFGAHAFKNALAASGRLDTYETAVRYQFYGAFGLLVAGLLAQWAGFDLALLQRSAGSQLLGILIFSGSLYLLCATGMRWLGAITPIGGVFMIVGWALMAWAVWKKD
jgi:uncharacterized membrane protein YgdD (TMEM256/DUF423 family)